MQLSNMLPQHEVTTYLREYENGSRDALDKLFPLVYDELRQLAASRLHGGERSEFDPKQAKIVELKFFAGLANEEIAEILGVCDSTIEREWRIAKAWLHNQLKG